MGGLGSGNWNRYDTKGIVENSMVLEVGNFYRRRTSKASGSFVWSWADGHQFSVGYSTSWGAATIITLNYRWRECEDIRLPIRTQYTPTQFNGERLWFTCPLALRGVPCNRRVGKLYLPRCEKYFGCRKCHGLTYQSCQEAHQEERLFAALERLPTVS